MQVSGDDVIIGKSAQIKKSDFGGTNSRDEELELLLYKTRKDCSTLLKHSENGKIDQVVLTVNESG